MQEWNISEQSGEKYFRALWKYISDDMITDIEFDSGKLWVKRVNKVRERVFDEEVTSTFIENFADRLGSSSGKNFNPINAFLCFDMATLRITCVHPSVSISGISVCIRKSLPMLRFNRQSAIKDGYCQMETMKLLIYCVLARLNVTYVGEPGKGKTECGKFFSGFIPGHLKVLTIEDVPEWHFSKLYPQKSAIELKTNGKDYKEILSVALRLNPSWIFFAESRSREVKYLLESWSNGIPTMTTLHVDDVRNIPDRILNMLDKQQDAHRIVNQIYNNAGVGILLQEVEIGNGKTKHMIGQVGFYYRENGENQMALVVEDGVFYRERIPTYIRDKIEKRIGRDLFTSLEDGDDWKNC